jgi:hypothetical protein
MSLRSLLFLSALVSVLVLAACSKDDATKPPGIKEDPSFSADIQPIVTANCALSSCHASPGQAGMILSQGEAYMNIVNVNSTEVPSMMRVRPTLPDSSYMILKLEGRQSVGGQMPPPGPLSSTNIRLMRNWITKGAQNN